MLMRSRFQQKRLPKRVFNIERFEFDELMQSEPESEEGSGVPENLVEGERSKKIKLI